MYTTHNFKTKKELKQAVKNGEKLTVFQPNDMFGANTTNGRVTLEGPHYPAPHKWYAQAELKDGYIVKIS